MFDSTGIDARIVYSHRFDADIHFRNQMWKILCQNYFQRFIAEDATVLEIAAGYCEFINNIRAKRKIAIDINEETRRRAGPDVEVILTPSTDLSAIPDETTDVVFASNFFEHIGKPDITKTLQECYRVLKSTGCIIILQPNIRFLHKDYWMFYDHITPIDDRALCEILEVLTFRIKVVLPKFLPYTTRNKFIRSLSLLKLYLKMPFFYPLFGRQALIIAQKSELPSALSLNI